MQQKIATAANQEKACQQLKQAPSPVNNESQIGWQSGELSKWKVFWVNIGQLLQYSYCTEDIYLQAEIVELAGIQTAHSTRTPPSGLCRYEAPFPPILLGIMPYR